jgi:hypothetical protein
MITETITTGKKPVYKRYHKHCHELYLKDKEFREQEQIKKDALNETIKEIYGVKDIPNQAWTLIACLREGNPVFGSKQKITKRYKEGYDYLLIKETFEYCTDTIEYWNRVKNFDGFMSAFKYAMSIIIDKIYVVEQRKKDRERQQMMTDKHLEELNNDEHDFVSGFKKKEKSNTDITDFLD